MPPNLKFDSETLGLLKLFRQATSVDARDCFSTEEFVIFLAEPGKAGLAIGKAGENVKKLASLLKKNVRVYEYAEGPCGLVKNFIYPAKADIQVKDEGRLITISFENMRERRNLLSNNLQNLKLLKEIVKRHHPEIQNVVTPLTR
jgi:NusA-like KH domain protein